MDLSDVNGASNPPLIFRPNSPRLELIFNNRCRTPMGYNDSVHVYDWVVDATGQRFEFGDCSIVRREDTTIAEDVKAVPDSRQLSMAPDNCDPVIIEPPPPGVWP